MGAMSTFVVEPARTGTESLPDGRSLGWAEWGPAGGTPVLFSPGAATSRRLGFGAAVVDALDIRLIAVDRPGLGASTPHPGRTFTDFATDIAAFARSRDLGRPLMVGNSQGAPFALACAAAGVITALALVSPADEVAEPRFADVLPQQLRQLIDTAITDPVAAERIFAEFTPQAMVDMVLAGSPDSDLAVYRDETFAAAYRSALDEAFAQGPAGYARDTALAMDHWNIDLAAIRIPVDIWYGEQDTSHSPDLGAGLAQRIPSATRHLVAGIGGALLWTEPEPILRALLAHAVSNV